MATASSIAQSGLPNRCQPDVARGLCRGPHLFRVQPGHDQVRVDSVFRSIIGGLAAAAIAMIVSGSDQVTNDGPPICPLGNLAPVLAADPAALPAPLRVASFEPAPLSQVAQSVGYLRDKYGVSVEEAQFRLILQEEAELLGPWLQARYPASLGELSLDQTRGVIVVRTTDLSTLELDAELNAYIHRDRVDLRQTRWPERELRAYGECLSVYLGKVDPLVELVPLWDADTGLTTLSVADNEHGRAFLADSRIRDLIDRSRGAIVEGTHPVRGPILQRPV